MSWEGRMRNPRICVVGAANMDLISYVPRLPRMGETLHGSRFHMGYGGKGANQAVMAAKLGAEVVMVAKLGRDVFGEGTLENFRSWGVDTAHVSFTDQAFSGVAPIAVDPQGRNSIIIVTGANDLLSPEDVERARPAIASSRVMVCQLEAPLDTSLAALGIAREQGVTAIFNPAPARPELPASCYQLSDVFCPNESETEMLLGRPVTSPEEADEAARALIERGARSVVLTLGERGCLVAREGEAVHLPAEPVEAVDSIASPTSAGSGRTSTRPPLPRMVSSAARQFTSASCSRPTSPPRTASRAIVSKTA
ncbi:MAG TPA: ribokinase [Candidatus Polarisedimenticolia bacterium]